MSSLTEVAHVSRKIIKYGGIGLIAFLILWSGGVAIISAYRAAHPPYVAPTVRFGVLKKITFPEKQFEVKNFTAELPDDKFPSFKDQANIYVIYRSQSPLGAMNEAKKTAVAMGFKGEARESATGVYQFSDPETNRTLEMNVLQSSFKMSYPYLTDQMLQNPENMPSINEAITQAKSYLDRIGKLPEELATGEQKTSLWKISFNGLQEVEGLSEADIVRVDFFRKNMVEGVEMVSSDPKKAPVSVLVSGSSVNDKRIVEVNYKHLEIDTSPASLSTYPIKTVEEAFDDLKKGNYWPASDSQTKDVVIRKIYLAYFEPVDLNNYLQPVYVFESDKQSNFVGYVRAVTDNYAK
ncbi:hypothetical protein KBB92_00980 [Candidatus Shapirobacteria bacterium]|nr:hypothetical protein [Candidatus Shapirobacteria bacterium]HQI12994.1 hypothetical protein [Candidatus Woesebacteria bacterium]